MKHIGEIHDQAPFVTDLPAFLDRLDAKLAGHLAAGCRMLSTADMRSLLREARSRPTPTPALGWSKWLDWAGGPCPLPPNALVTVTLRDSHANDEVECAGNYEWRHYQSAADIIRFRYRCDPSGWLPRGNWVPPESAYPLGVRFASGEESEIESINETNSKPSYWNSDSLIGGRITHIRLLPREKAGEMPEGFAIDRDGWLTAPDGRAVIAAHNFHLYGPDKIRRAVDAWLASMKERGNG